MATHLYRCLSGILIVAAFVVSASAQPAYRYSVNLENVQDDQLQVELICPPVQQTAISFYMPRIVPGTYMNSNFGKYVHLLRAYNAAGDTLPVQRVNDNEWRISNATTLSRISYRVEDTWDATIDNMVYPMCGTSFEAGKNFVLNTCGIFGYLEGMKKVPFELSFTRPASFYAATALRPVQTRNGFDMFRCTTADELYDSPIMFSVPDTATVQVGPTEVLVAVYAPGKMVNAKFVAGNMQKILQGTREYLKGKLPVDRYAFIFYFNSEQPALQVQGAWEHSYSSFYSVQEMPQEMAIGGWRDMAAHEFFHIVSPLNTSSREVKEFNFNETVLSKHLWLYEGSTEYDAQHMQVWTGLKKPSEFLDDLAGKIRFSRQYFIDSLPFTELSKESAGKWHEQYPNVYLKGAAISACLDLYLLHLSQGRYSLQDLKHDLGVRYGKDKYFLDDELFAEIEKLTYPEIRQFLETYVAGPTPIPYEKYLAMGGVQYLPEKTIQSLGLGGINIKPGKDDLMWVSTENINQFGKQMGFRDGDQLISINGRNTLSSNFGEEYERFMRQLKEGDLVEVWVWRREGKKKKQKVKLSAKAFPADRKVFHQLEFIPAPTAAQVKVRNAWLGNYPPDVLLPVIDSADVATVEATVAALYQVISGPAGPRNWSRFRQLFHPSAMMASFTPAKELRRFTPEEYIQRNGPMFMQYSFDEKELGRRVQQFGNIAQVFTSYAFTAGMPQPLKMRGINSIELIRENGRWWIMSITWDQETPEQPIPEKYIGF